MWSRFRVRGHFLPAPDMSRNARTAVTAMVRPTSDLGQKRTCTKQQPMSASGQSWTQGDCTHNRGTTSTSLADQSQRGHSTLKQLEIRP